MMKKTGHCLCGRVRFGFESEAPQTSYCHCSQCRRQTGHVFASVGVLRRDLHIENADTLTWYKSSQTGERGFCNACGSVLFWRPIDEDQDFTAVSVGSLDDSSGIIMQHHLYVPDKGDYYEINDSLLQHETEPDAECL